MNVMPRKDKQGAQMTVNGKLVWRLRWETKDPGTGKRRYVYETFHGSKREAERRWIAREAEIREAGVHFVKRPSRLTVGEYLQRWLDEYADQHCKPTTAASYRTLVNVHIAPGLGAVPLADLTAAQVSAWQAELARKRNGRNGTLSPRRVAYARAVLRAALHEAVRLRLIPTNPVELVRAPKQAPREIQAFTLQEVQALDRAAEGHRLAALVRMAWRTGLRLGELLALTWADVDFDARTILVRRNLVEVEGQLVIQDAPKTEKGRRTVAMTATVAAELKAHKARQAAERLKAGAAWQGEDLIFCTRTGKALAPRNVERLWYSLRDKAGIPPYGFHSLRHTYATLAKRAGVPIEEIADALGHESPAFTAKVYAHVVPEGRREAADRFEAFTQGR